MYVETYIALAGLLVCIVAFIAYADRQYQQARREQRLAQRNR